MNKKRVGLSVIMGWITSMLHGMNIFTFLISTAIFYFLVFSGFKKKNEEVKV